MQVKLKPEIELDLISIMDVCIFFLLLQTQYFSYFLSFVSSPIEVLTLFKMSSIKIKEVLSYWGI